MVEESKSLRVFFLEDNPADVELELHELEKAGFKVIHDVARNRKTFFEKIPRFAPDVVLADYALPDITGIEAIDLCKKMEIEVPVILMTGEGNEQMAVDSLRHGAIDYIIKRNLSGLPARLSRALEIWADRKAKKRAEAEERRLQQLLFEAQKMEAIGRVAGGIAHDFNNILTGIMGFAEVCLDDATKDLGIHDCLQSILASSRRGADLIKQLLIFGSRMPIELKSVDLNSFMRETVQFLNRIVGDTVEIRLDLQEDITKVKCDTGQFMRVLMNLVLNARDAMNGAGVIMIKTEKCLLPEDFAPAGSESNREGWISISVSDTGIGIQENDIKKIFEPFYTTKATGKGTGLGLSIVHSVVSAHGGWIKVFSQKGVGTTFSIYLPVLRGDSPAGIFRFYGSDKEGHIDKITGNETVLIAEDEEMLRELSANTLRSYGYDVVVAKNGEEALDIFRAEHRKIDLVVSDMQMPKKNGVELFKELRLINPQVKFLLITGYSLAEQDEKTLKLMDAVLTKPYTPTQIATVMRAILDK